MKIVCSHDELLARLQVAARGVSQRSTVQILSGILLVAEEGAAELAATTITARDEQCPMFVSFTEGESAVEHDSFDDVAIQKFVEPYVTP